MQVVAGLAIAAVVTAGAAAVMVPAYNATIMNSCFEEVNIVVVAIRNVREFTGSYAASDTTVQALVQNGYLPNPPYNNGVGENRLGNDIDISGTGATAEVKYILDTNPQCAQIEQRLDSLIGVTNITCSGTSLEFEVN